MSGIPDERRLFPVTVPIIFLRRSFQPLLDEVQHVPINDPMGEALRSDQCAVC